jgi:hypothetical protein
MRELYAVPISQTRIESEEPTRGRAPRTLGELKPRVRELLSNTPIHRHVKERVGELIGRFLLANDRLLVENSDQDNPKSYLITDTGAVVPISETPQRLRLALQDSGLNPTEKLFQWIVEDLRHRASREGRQVQLVRYSVYRDGALYVSSGSSRMIVARMQDGEPMLDEHPNGFDDILFAADGCFAPWTISKEPRVLESCAAFFPNLVAPTETPDYDAQIQHLLFEGWIYGLLARHTLPVLTSIGNKGCGKSVQTRALVKLLSGNAADVANQPQNQRDFFTAATSLPLYAIDNLDGKPDKWLPDALAAACTGVSQTDRQLFSNSNLFRKPVTACFAVTTRTATFAERPDIAERVLPLFYGPLAEEERRDDAELLREVAENRDALMTGLVIGAVRTLSEVRRDRGLPGASKASPNW